MADPLSRAKSAEETKNHVESPKIDLSKCVSHTSRSQPCELCPGCHISCQRMGNHADCKFNIKNKGSKYPKLIDYPTQVTDTVTVEGKEIKYKLGRLEFNPTKYRKIDIAKVIENMGEYKPWDIYELPNADDHLLEGVRKHVKAGTVKEFREQEVEAIASLAKEFKEAMVRRVEQGVWTDNTNPISVQGVVPKSFSVTTRDDQQISSVHTDTTIVLFASLTRSFKFRHSLYNSGLRNTTVEQFYRKSGQVNKYVVNDQPYLVVTVPPNQPGEATVSSEQIFRLLATTAQKLEKTEQNRTIIFHADLIYVYFKIKPKLALVAITLAMAHNSHLFKGVEVQASARLAKLVTKEVLNKLDKQILIGKILRRSYRNIRPILPSAEILSTAAFPRWADQHPLTIVHNDTLKTTTTPTEAAQEYKTALKHIAELYSFLSPILPSVAESQRTIEIYRQRGQEDSNAQDKDRNQLEKKEDDLEEEQEEDQEAHKEEANEE